MIFSNASIADVCTFLAIAAPKKSVDSPTWGRSRCNISTRPEVDFGIFTTTTSKGSAIGSLGRSRIDWTMTPEAAPGTLRSRFSITACRPAEDSFTTSGAELANPVASAPKASPTTITFDDSEVHISPSADARKSRTYSSAASQARSGRLPARGTRASPKLP